MNKLSLFQKLIIINLVFGVILVGLLWITVRAKDEPIQFAIQEKKGNRYQKPVEALLEHLSKHKIHLQRALSGDANSKDQIKNLEAKIADDFSMLTEVNNQVGTELHFTDEGLSSRKRDHFKLSTIKLEWENLLERSGDLKPDEVIDRHTHLIADMRMLIVHAGDTSNLILDPDLDSYYLMDATLVAYPQMQDRIQEISTFIFPLLDKKTITQADRVKLAVYSALLKQSDYDRLTGDVQTALNEDKNFYGVSDSLQTRLPDITREISTLLDSYLASINKLADSPEVNITRGEFATLTDATLDSSYKSWQSSVEQLDVLLQHRIEVLKSSQHTTTALSLVALLAYGIFAFFFSKSLSKTISVVIGRLRISSHSVEEASRQSAANANSLSASSAQQADSLQETMASAAQIAAMVDQNAESAAKAKVVVDQNAHTTEEGSQSVSEMLLAIAEIKTTNDEILSQMKSSNREFGNIAKIISEIGDKTKVIDDIVFQTKLLSFNASVEAARAGEHGKGFAVVAEEVGNLAQMSGNAAKEITDMLDSSVRKVNAIVEQTTRRVDQLAEVGKHKVMLGESTAQKCREALSKVSMNAHTVAQMVTEISSASKEQAQGVQEINKAIALLDQVTQQNTVVAQQSALQSTELRAESSRLGLAVDGLEAYVTGAGANVVPSADDPNFEEL